VPVVKPELVVVALGGNALAPPGGAPGLGVEREVVRRAAAELATALRGRRLLVVHGNGPQVGRLLAAPGVGDPSCLDVHVAQTQGEIGYLLADALEAGLGEPCAALVTRVLVAPDDAAFATPTKPVGMVLPAPPAGVPAVRTPDGRGWRRVVASPRPRGVIELEAVRALLAHHHVVAGGGGGIALAGDEKRRAPCPAVVDKDWVASMIAVAMDAARLVFVTDVPHAFDAFGHAEAHAIGSMSVPEAHERLARGTFGPGSMEPKVESAVEFVQATGRPAVITTLGAIASGMRGQMGTTVHR
jgi:carbamate kinase